MKFKIKKFCGMTTLLASLGINGIVQAQDEPSPLQDGLYVAPMASFVHSLQLGNGVGAVLLSGFRNEFYAIEAGGIFTSLGDGEYLGGVINGLLFPFKAAPNLYLTTGLGALQVSGYPTRPKGEFSQTTVDAGLGYLWPITWGRYEFALRGEARYRHGHRESRINALRLDIDVPKNFSDTVINIGLQLPLGFKPVPAPPSPPVEVVPPQIPSDGEAR